MKKKEVIAVLKDLTFAAETSGGTAGKDEGLQLAIARAAAVLKEADKPNEQRRLLEEAQVMLHELIQVLNGSYELDGRYMKAVDLSDKIEEHLYPKTEKP